MSEGWILDAHLRSGSDLVTVWVKEDSGAVSEHSFRWSPVIHVSGRPESLQELEVSNGKRLPLLVRHCQYRQGASSYQPWLRCPCGSTLNRGAPCV